MVTGDRPHLLQPSKRLRRCSWLRRCPVSKVDGLGVPPQETSIDVEKPPTRGIFDFFRYNFYGFYGLVLHGLDRVISHWAAWCPVASLVLDLLMNWVSSLGWWISKGWNCVNMKHSYVRFCPFMSMIPSERFSSLNQVMSVKQCHVYHPVDW